MSHITPPKYVINVLSRLERHGYSAYMVGGCVRDILMNRRPNDWDVCTSALPEEIMSVFSNSRPTGIKHGTVTVIEHGSSVEVTTFRADGEYNDHRHPGNVRFISDLRSDLERRDFTVNAAALPLSGLLFDPFGGIEDIKKMLIRCVGDPNMRFNEDALRMLRAFRFSAVLGFEIERQTLEAIRNNSPLVDTLAKERIASELEKILLSDSPQVLSDVIGYGLLNGVIADYTAKADLSVLKKLPKNRAHRWTGFCALLQKSGIINDAEKFLITLRLDSTTIRNSVTGLTLAISDTPTNKLEWKKLLSRNGTDIGNCTAAAAETLYGTGYIRALHAVTTSSECFSLKRLSVSGDDLLDIGFRGPELGKVLYALLDHVIENPDNNHKENLLELARDAHVRFSNC